MGEAISSNGGVYLEGAFGGAYRDVPILRSLSYTANVLGHEAGPITANDKIVNQWGWTAGANLGYNFSNFIATEFGLYYIQKVEYLAGQGSIYVNPNGQLSHFGYSNWLFYLAPKITFLRFKNFNTYIKFGIGLNHYNFINDTTFMYYHSGNYYGTWKHSSFNGVAPLFAVGASHDLNPNLYIGVQYMRFGSSWNTSKIHSQNQVFEHRGLGTSWTTPATSAIDILQVSLGYRF